MIEEGIPDFLLHQNRDKPMARPEKPLVHSYSSLHAYEDVCPYRYFRTYIVRDIKYIEDAKRKKGNEMHAAMELRIGGKPLPPDLQHLEKWAAPFDGRGARSEGKLGMTRDGKSCGFFDDNVFLRGAIDVSIVKQPVGYILDWKTGKSRYEDRFELDVHALLLHARYPQLTSIRAQYCYTSEDKVSDPFDCSNTRATWQHVHEVAQEIEDTKARGAEFEKRPNFLCGYCDVIDCKHNTNPNPKRQ